MATSKTSIDAKLEALELVASQASDEELAKHLTAALAARNHRLVAKAATIAAEKLCYAMHQPLVDAYHRFLKDPLKTDKTCLAKRALVKALYDLDYNDTEFYCEGMRYQQLEPVWGGTVDSAVEVRCTCALGLVAAGHTRAALALLGLLHDAEPQARLGAVRAIALLVPYQAELLLRAKVLQGDSEPEILYECFSALLAAAPLESIEFVAAYLNDDAIEIHEAAALAMGESRMDQALAALRACWQQVYLPAERRQIVLRAIALQRCEPAYAFLLSIIDSASSSEAMAAVKALAIYRHNDDLRARVAKQVQGRGQDVQQAYTQAWD